MISLSKKRDSEFTKYTLAWVNNLIFNLFPGGPGGGGGAMAPGGAGGGGGGPGGCGAPGGSGGAGGKLGFTFDNGLLAL